MPRAAPAGAPHPSRHYHAQRTTHHAPPLRTTHHAAPLRTTYHAPRTTHHVPRTTHHVPRTTHRRYAPRTCVTHAPALEPFRSSARSHPSPDRYGSDRPRRTVPRGPPRPADSGAVAELPA